MKSRSIRWEGLVAYMGESRSAYRVLVGKPEGERQCGKSRHTWEDNIKMYLKEIGWEGMDWICLAQDRVTSGLL
jgi:hypothetical protein